MNTWAETEAVLSLRDTEQSLESTAVAPEVQAVWPTGDYAPGDGHYLIFVHGYSNSYGEARVSYARMRWWLDELQTSIRVLELHWPGDSKRKLISKLVYSKRIGTARRCGEALGRWIARAHPESSFSILGHSLGCRVVVHAVDELRRRQQISRVRSICLMAAAVPVRCILKDKLGARSEEQSLTWRVLYSRGDGVLRWAFPAGQSVGALLYRNTRFGNVAVGLNGEPRDVWELNNADRWELYDSGDPVESAGYYGHSWYWPGGYNYPAPLSRISSDPTPHDNIHGRALGNKGESSELLAQLMDGNVARRISIRPPPFARGLPERRFGDYFDT